MEGLPVYGYAGSRKVTESAERWLERRKETRKQKEKKSVDEMLLERIISKSKMQLAYKQVVGNKGAGGVDGIEVADFPVQLKAE
jgi:RNA-directed DNA polymerase